MARGRRAIETEDEELARLLGNVPDEPARAAPVAVQASEPVASPAEDRAPAQHPLVRAAVAEAWSLPPTYTLARDVKRHFLTDFLPHIERMAAQQLDIATIAARLGHSSRVLEDAAARFEDVLLALTGGKARGLDDISGALYRNAMIGETGAQTFILRTRGGFTVASERAPSGGSGEGEKVIDVTLDNVNALADRQRALNGPE